MKPRVGAERRKRGGKLGFAIVAWIEASGEWGVFAQGEKRELLASMCERLQMFGLIARVVDCELEEGGAVSLFAPLGDPEDLPLSDVGRAN